MAAPHIAGLAAYLLSSGKLTIEELCEYIKASAFKGLISELPDGVHPICWRAMEQVVDTADYVSQGYWCIEAPASVILCSFSSVRLSLRTSWSEMIRFSYCARA